jgi:mRNA-degrading endonuclease toxin of MazEF toxin-antitoxin module
VNISQIFTADKSALKDKIGTLSRQRIQEVISSLGLLFRPQDLPKTPGSS